MHKPECGVVNPAAPFTTLGEQFERHGKKYRVAFAALAAACSVAACAATAPGPVGSGTPSGLSCTLAPSTGPTAPTAPAASSGPSGPETTHLTQPNRPGVMSDPSTGLNSHLDDSQPAEDRSGGQPWPT
jgi:hypothetical protein